MYTVKKFGAIVSVPLTKKNNWIVWICWRNNQFIVGTMKSIVQRKWKWNTSSLDKGLFLIYIVNPIKQWGQEPWQRLSMVKYRTAVYPLLTDWVYCSRALNHRYAVCPRSSSPCLRICSSNIWYLPMIPNIFCVNVDLLYGHLYLKNFQILFSELRCNFLGRLEPPVTPLISRGWPQYSLRKLSLWMPSWLDNNWLKLTWLLPGVIVLLQITVHETGVWH